MDKGILTFLGANWCQDEYKYNVEAVELLVHHLVNMQQYDLHLAQVWRELSGKGDW